MKRTLIVSLCVVFALSLLVVGTSAKNTRGKFADYNFVELPSMPANGSQPGGPDFVSAQVGTSVLGWWQFDTPTGQPTKEGWTEHDMTTQIKDYFHVDGPICAPSSVSAVNGLQSMWCGQWATTAVPWCGWASLPGYGNSWEQYLVCDPVNAGAQMTYTTMWDSEPGYDKTYVQSWDDMNLVWVDIATVNGGAGAYDGSGGPIIETVTDVSGTVQTAFRFYFTSDGASSDEDGLYPTTEGSFKVDDISVTDPGPVDFEDWEDEACFAGSSNSGFWAASSPPGFGLYTGLHNGVQVVQEDPCHSQLSNLWGFFDDPLVTNYACGGWPNQGAMPYGPDANGLYMYNEVWSPFVTNNVGPGAGGSQYQLQFLVYRDLPLDNLQFYTWSVRQKDGAGCQSAWRNDNQVYHGGEKDWLRTQFEVGSYLSPTDGDIQVAIGAVDMCGVWCGAVGTGMCHSHAPLIDEVRLVQINTQGPQWVVQDTHMWQDNFPELGGIGPTDYTRCDMAQDILPTTNPDILPGDSLVVRVADPNGLAVDNTGGRPGKAIYVFVTCTDRFGTPRPYTGLQMQSPDNTAWSADPNAGLIRWPFVGSVVVGGKTWHKYRLDQTYTTVGSSVSDSYCADLMDLAAGPDGPPYHPNENWVANTGIFVPGDVIWYFFGAQNTLGQWSYLSRDSGGRGRWLRTNDMAHHTALDANGVPKAACEWSVLPDAGRQLTQDYLERFLVVDEADKSDRGREGLHLEAGFKYLLLHERTDTYDTLGSRSGTGNGVQSRVKSLFQLTGYAILVFNSSNNRSGISGSNETKTDNLSLAVGLFGDLTLTHDRGAFLVGNNYGVIIEGSYKIGSFDFRATYMNTSGTTGDQRVFTGEASTRVEGTINWKFKPELPALQSAESFYVFGGCPGIEDFDVPGQAGRSWVAHRYGDATTGPTAALAQSTPNAAGDTARVYLAGFGFDFIRDDDTDGVPDYVVFLKEVLAFLRVETDDPVGIGPVTFENRLDNNYPNPFNPTTTIKYSIAAQGHVSLKIYNAAGQLVRTLVDDVQTPVQGGFSQIWNGQNNQGQSVSSGVYFYKLVATNFTQTKKMVMLK